MLIRSIRQSDLQTVSDEIIIKQYKTSGEQHLIDELFKRYVHLLYGLCLNILKDKAESKDVVMESFAKMMERLEKEEVLNVKHWLTTLTRNAAISRFRKTQKARGLENEYKQQALSYVEDSGFTRKYDNEEADPDAEPLENIVKKAITKLPHEQKECIQLFFYQKKKYREIAVLTGYSLDKVKSHLQNGKRNLRISLTEAGLDKILIWLILISYF